MESFNTIRLLLWLNNHLRYYKVMCIHYTQICFYFNYKKYNNYKMCGMFKPFVKRDTKNFTNLNPFKPGFLSNFKV